MDISCIYEQRLGKKPRLASFYWTVDRLIHGLGGPIFRSVAGANQDFAAAIRAEVQVPPSELRGPFDARSIIFSEPRQNVSGHFRIADSIPEFTCASENDSILGASQGHLIG